MYPLLPALNSILPSFNEVVGDESRWFFVAHESHSYFYAYVVSDIRRASYDFVQSGSSEHHNPGEADAFYQSVLIIKR